MNAKRRSIFVCLGVGLAAIVVRLALLPVRPIPEPVIQDEFAYLLGAETFCAGRVANPPHPMWMHFEPTHENSQPAYASKYPPGQSLFLALGWSLFGHPWYGVLLSCGAMCAALCWMLQGWLPPRYAVLGGLMAAAQWGIAGYWVNSYWGGAVAAAAGALVIGAVPRLARRPSAGVAGLATLGVLALANSRPYEGAITVAAAAAALWIWRRRAGRPVRDLFARQAAGPAALILTCGAAAMLYYNYRLTGNALLMPYALNQRTYGVASALWILPLATAPAYRYDIVRRLWTEYDVGLYWQARSWPPHVAALFARMLWYNFLTVVSSVALLSAVLLRRGRKVWMALGMAGAATAGLLLEKYPNPHYFAPATGLVLLLVMLGAQYLRVRVGSVAMAVFATLFFATAALHAVFINGDEYSHRAFAAHRLSVIRRLESQAGRQLAIIRYAPDHDPLEEWVYNHADIDGSGIVWARDMGTVGNRELIDYYKDRQAWMVRPDVPAGTDDMVRYGPR